MDVSLSKDGALVTINSNDRVSSEVRLVRCDAPLEAPILVHPRQEGVQYFVEHNKVRCADCQTNPALAWAPCGQPVDARHFG